MYCPRVSNSKRRARVFTHATSDHKMQPNEEDERHDERRDADGHCCDGKTQRHEHGDYLVHDILKADINAVNVCR